MEPQFSAHLDRPSSNWALGLNTLFIIMKRNMCPADNVMLFLTLSLIHPRQLHSGSSLHYDALMVLTCCFLLLFSVQTFLKSLKNEGSFRNASVTLECRTHLCSPGIVSSKISVSLAGLWALLAVKRLLHSESYWSPSSNLKLGRLFRRKNVMIG